MFTFAYLVKQAAAEGASKQDKKDKDGFTGDLRKSMRRSQGIGGATLGAMLGGGAGLTLSAQRAFTRGSLDNLVLATLLGAGTGGLAGYHLGASYGGSRADDFVRDVQENPNKHRVLLDDRNPAAHGVAGAIGGAAALATSPLLNALMDGRPQPWGSIAGHAGVGALLGGAMSHNHAKLLNRVTREQLGMDPEG